jgi:hypothetical protein
LAVAADATSSTRLTLRHRSHRIERRVAGIQSTYSKLTLALGMADTRPGFELRPEDIIHSRAEVPRSSAAFAVAPGCAKYTYPTEIYCVGYVIGSAG